MGPHLIPHPRHSPAFWPYAHSETLGRTATAQLPSTLEHWPLSPRVRSSHLPSPRVQECAGIWVLFRGHVSARAFGVQGTEPLNLGRMNGR